jgi:hypothetical protein
MQMKRTLRVVALVLLTAIGAGCDDTAEPPVPGSLLLSLTTPATDDGAILVRVTGPGIMSVGPTSSGQELFWRLAAEDEARAIVLGSVQAGPLLTIQVPDVNRADEYTAEVGEVAAESDALRDALAGYTVTVARVGANR